MAQVEDDQIVLGQVGPMALLLDIPSRDFVLCIQTKLGNETVTVTQPLRSEELMQLGILAIRQSGRRFVFNRAPPESPVVTPTDLQGLIADQVKEVAALVAGESNDDQADESSAAEQPVDMFPDSGLRPDRGGYGFAPRKDLGLGRDGVGQRDGESAADRRKPDQQARSDAGRRQQRIRDRIRDQSDTERQPGRPNGHREQPDQVDSGQAVGVDGGSAGDAGDVDHQEVRIQEDPNQRTALGERGAGSSDSHTDGAG